MPLTSADPAIAAAKQVMREEMLARRGSLNAAEREAAARAIAEHDLHFISLRAGAVVAGYAAIGEELDSLPLMLRLSARGHALGLPVTRARGQPLVFRRWAPGDALVHTGFGLRVPPRGVDEVTPDVLLVPLLAFDARGYRLGYGAGHYDRTLGALRARKPIVAIGMAHDIQQVENVPHDGYDKRLDWVLTPSGATRFEGA